MLNYPFKILYIHQDGDYTGSFMSMMNMIEGFEDGKVRPVILFLKNGPAVQGAQAKGIETIVHHGKTFWTAPGPKWNQRGTLNNMKALIPDFKLRKIIKTVSPNLIHINDKAAINAGISSIGLKIPIIQHLRSSYYTCNFFLHKWISICCIKLYSNLCIAISEDEASDFNSKKTKVVFNSISMDAIGNAISSKITIENNRVNIGWIGRFTYGKGAWDFLDIANNLNKLFPNSLHFHMLAPLPTEDDYDLINQLVVKTKEYLNQKINDYHLAEHITLHGYRKDFLSVAASMDIMINCNRLGEMGRQAFECACLGIPTIVTVKHPGRSSVLNNQVAFVCKEGDINNITSCAEKLVKDPLLRSDFSVKAYDWGTGQFNARKQSKKVYEIYSRLIIS